MTAQDTWRRDAQTALIAVELARVALDIENLSTEDLVDDSLNIDRSEARMQRIIKADAIRLAHEAIIALIARRNEARVTSVAYELDARLTSAQQLVAEWYAQRLHARKATGEAKEAALAKSSQLLSSARSALGELRTKADELRQVTLGQPKSYRPTLINSSEQMYQADVAQAARRVKLLDAAREAEARFRQAQEGRAPAAELHRLALDLDAALTDAMRAAYAAERAEIGPRGYEDRIYRRKAMAKPRVHALTAQAERLLTLRETHRINGIPTVTFEPGPPPSPVS